MTDGAEFLLFVSELVIQAQWIAQRKWNPTLAWFLAETILHSFSRE
jgi:hypothetical protein